jgi:peptidoglycan/LPS O-acetylase OafA/YrhL
VKIRLNIFRFEMGRTIVSEDISHTGNIFNILRTIFATAVIFSHAFVLTGHIDPSTIMLPYSVSRFAVLLFFTLSGFLVTNSLQTRGVWQFARARALRMLPGLWVMLLVSSAVATIAFGTFPLRSLPGNTSLWQYLFSNGLLIGRHYDIDGVFLGNPLPTIVNGALWTIPREVQCYVALALVGAVGLLNRPRVLLTCYIIGTCVHIMLPPDLVPALSALRPLVISFFAGVLMFLFRSKVYLSWQLAVLTILLTIATDPGPLRELAAQLSAAYVALVIAFIVPSSWKRFSKTIPDYSFGIYIYGFPVQQAMIATGFGITAGSNMLATLVCVVPMAALSWHLVEKPALARKDRRENSSQAAGTSSTPADSVR